MWFWSIWTCLVLVPCLQSYSAFCQTLKQRNKQLENRRGLETPIFRQSISLAKRLFAQPQLLFFSVYLMQAKFQLSVFFVVGPFKQTWICYFNDFNPLTVSVFYASLVESLLLCYLIEQLHCRISSPPKKSKVVSPPHHSKSKPVCFFYFFIQKLHFWVNYSQQQLDCIMESGKLMHYAGWSVMKFSKLSCITHNNTIIFKWRLIMCI